MMISCRKEGGKEGGKVSRERLNASLGPSLSAQWTEFDVGAGADGQRCFIPLSPHLTMEISLPHLPPALSPSLCR